MCGRDVDFGRVGSHDVDEKTVAFSCCGAPWLRFEIAAAGVVYSLAVLTHPFAHLGKAYACFGRQFAAWLRANVEKQVGATAGSADEHTDKCGGVFVFVVGSDIAPFAVHGLTCLERQFADRLFAVSCGIFSREIALEELYVLTFDYVAVVVVGDES